MDTVAQRPAPHRVSLALPGVSLELGGEGEEEEKKKQEGGRQREGGREGDMEGIIPTSPSPRMGVLVLDLWILHS